MLGKIIAVLLQKCCTIHESRPFRYKSKRSSVLRNWEQNELTNNVCFQWTTKNGSSSPTSAWYQTTEECYNWNGINQYSKISSIIARPWKMVSYFFCYCSFEREGQWTFYAKIPRTFENPISSARVFSNISSTYQLVAVSMFPVSRLKCHNSPPD